jgi:LppX_LprAFG lipoprotein
VLRRFAPVLAVMVVLLAACQSTPAITDPAEIITQGLDATAKLNSFHVSLKLDGDFTVPDGGGTFNLDSTSLEADVDIPAKNVRAHMAVPAFLGLTADVVVIGPDLWIKTSMTGTKWSHQTNDLMGSPSPSASADPQVVIDQVKEALEKDGVVTKKLADVACGDRQCYQVSVKVPSALMSDAGAVASFDPSSVFGDAVEINLLFDREKLWLTAVSTGIDNATVGKITATLTFSKFDEAVTFSPPPSPDVTEGEFTVPGM